MPKEIQPKFNVPDVDMIEASKTMRAFFLLDKADFVAFDADFDDPYKDDWQTAIDDAEAQPDDETTLDQQTQLTDDVEEKLADCRNKFQSSKYFIEKTFPDKPGIWNEFGYNDYDKVRKSQPLMIAFMKKFHTVATKYKVQLIAKGYSQLMIDEILTLRQALDEANVTQEVGKGSRFSVTETRREKMNAAYDIMVNTGKAGKTIYAENFAKFQRYLLPASDETSPSLSIKGTVTNQADGTALAGVLVLIVSLGIETTTDSNGKFVFGGLDAGTYTLHFEKAGFAEQNKDVTVVDGETANADVAMAA